MTSEAQIIIAFLFKRSGKNKLKEAEIYLPLSIDLRWFSTKEAQSFINFVLDQQLLTKKDGFFIPNFDIEKTVIPIGFHPTIAIFKEEKKNLKEPRINDINTIIDQIKIRTNKNQKEISEEIKQIAFEKNILPEVTMLLLAKRYNIDITDFFTPIENIILKENVE